MRFAGTACSFSILNIGFDEEVTHMCELFRLIGDDERDISADLREFFSHSVEHPQGWGLALGNQSSALNIEKEPLHAIDSSYPYLQRSWAGRREAGAPPPSLPPHAA